MVDPGTTSRIETSGPLPEEIDTWVFDLDNTLYSVTPEMSLQINQLMSSFISGFLDVDSEEARRIQKSYFRQYGLTVRGLILNHALDPQDYMAHMSQMDLSQIGPDPRLARAIERLDGRKVIYTNAFGSHTEIVLDRLGMTEHFDAIHDIETADFLPKPHIDAYHDLCRRHEIDPTRSVMVEDTPHNLVPAAEIGMTTVWIRTGMDWAQGGDGADYIHHVVEDLASWLEEAAPKGV